MITQLYKVYASWCGPCKQLEKELKGIDIPVISWNVDENQEFCDKYNIRNIPVLIYMDNDTEVYRSTGLVTKTEIENKLKELNHEID